MCGIAGIIISTRQGLPDKQFKQAFIHLLKLAESRGKEASGICSLLKGRPEIFKKNEPVNRLIKNREFQVLLDRTFAEKDSPLLLVGHSRMVTHGDADLPQNNQPVMGTQSCLIHNGIIVNHSSIFDPTSGLSRTSDLDSEAIIALVDSHLKQGDDFKTSLQKSNSRLKGTVTYAVLHPSTGRLGIFTNNGSCYTLTMPKSNALLFASEEYMLLQLKKKFAFFREGLIEHLPPGEGWILSADRARINKERFTQPQGEVLEKASISVWRPPNFKPKPPYQEFFRDNNTVFEKIKRCSQCLLPITFPFIQFNKAGVCNFCLEYRAAETKPEMELRHIASNLKSSRDRYNCIVPLSGGRDSTYALHYLKETLGLRPLAYTYDWGMVTDVARRNIARICGELQVEHILISADIHKKRKYIHQNVEAWLTAPKLGLIPLFMAGDKHFFYYSNQLRKHTGIQNIFYAHNPLEKTHFKVSFAHFRESENKSRYYHLSRLDKIRLAGFYGIEFFKNPKYLNSSIWDSFTGYMAYYFIPHQYTLLFDYLKWDENTVNSTIINRYGWEVPEDSYSTWRIGDGTAAFYNYIYGTVAGFTENDTFRSNQIREGLITREEGLRQVLLENLPQEEGFIWYCDTIKTDWRKAVKVINQMPKLYAKS